ncbi:unnamed protein product [Caenorhabditis sp. 36 PRJEB53466]|nr:unnamed protein product [Caenorhabditis sp. 36 PRJEB53466]
MKTWVFFTILFLATSNVTSKATYKRTDTMFLAMVCQDECVIDIRFLAQGTSDGLSPNNTEVLFAFTLSSNNGTLRETTIDVAENVDLIEFVYTVPDENGTTTETDDWNLNHSESYFHSIGSLQVVGNMPCGKYGCPQNPLCDGGCRFTVVASLAAFCFFVLAGLVLQTVYVSFLGFRRNRKEIELRDTLRLTEAAH